MHSFYIEERQGLNSHASYKMNSSSFTSILPEGQILTPFVFLSGQIHIMMRGKVRHPGIPPQAHHSVMNKIRLMRREKFH